MFNHMNIVYREQDFACPRPDLVLVSDDQNVYIIDVTVRNEEEGALQAVTVEKTETYDPLRTVISVMYPELRVVCVVPLVFGSLCPARDVGSPLSLRLHQKGYRSLKYSDFEGFPQNPSQLYGVKQLGFPGSWSPALRIL
jgi:hypothetical protein